MGWDGILEFRVPWKNLHDTLSTAETWDSGRKGLPCWGAWGWGPRLASSLPARAKDTMGNLQRVKAENPHVPFGGSRRWSAPLGKKRLLPLASFELAHRDPSRAWTQAWRSLGLTCLWALHLTRISWTKSPPSIRFHPFLPTHFSRLSSSGTSSMKSSQPSTWICPSELHPLHCLLSIIHPRAPHYYTVPVQQGSNLGPGSPQPTQCLLWVSLKILLFSRSVVAVSLQPHGLQPTRLPCPSLSPRACSNSCPLSRWCHPTISSSVAPLEACAPGNSGHSKALRGSPHGAEFWAGLPGTSIPAQPFSECSPSQNLSLPLKLAFLLKVFTLSNRSLNVHINWGKDSP